MEKTNMDKALFCSVKRIANITEILHRKKSLLLRKRTNIFSTWEVANQYPDQRTSAYLFPHGSGSAMINSLRIRIWVWLCRNWLWIHNNVMARAQSDIVLFFSPSQFTCWLSYHVMHYDYLKKKTMHCDKKRTKEKFSKVFFSMTTDARVL